ncbi:MAG: hypothetical protein NTW14_03850 [bacterium]|nr:hypothetical protein [bacterium]
MELMGEWYRDKVLNQQDLVEIDLPRGDGEIRIENELFCWRLYRGKNYIECATEEQARYLKVWLTSRQCDIFMPTDENYLKEILPDLEEVKEITDEVIEEKTDGIISYRKREKLLNLIWYKVMKDSFEAEEKVRERMYPTIDEDEHNDEDGESSDSSEVQSVDDEEEYQPRPRYQKPEKSKPQGKQLILEP